MNTTKSRRISCPLPPLPFISVTKTGVLRPSCAQFFPERAEFDVESEGLRCLTKIRNGRRNGNKSIVPRVSLVAGSFDNLRRHGSRPSPELSLARTAQPVFCFLWSLEVPLPLTTPNLPWPQAP